MEIYATVYCGEDAGLIIEFAGTMRILREKEQVQNVIARETCEFIYGVLDALKVDHDLSDGITFDTTETSCWLGAKSDDTRQALWDERAVDLIGKLGTEEARSYRGELFQFAFDLSAKLFQKLLAAWYVGAELTDE